MTGVDILLGALAAALIVVSGALYALFFALSRLRESPGLGRAAWAAYAALVVATLLLTRALSLDGAWLVVIATMLIGYFAAPHAIWHLSAATHAGSSPASRSRCGGTDSTVTGGR